MSLEDFAKWESNLRIFEKYVGKSYYTSADLLVLSDILASQIHLLYKYCEVGT